MECILCGEQIDVMHVQQGGMHVECYNSPQKVWEISLPDDPTKSYIESSMCGVGHAIDNSTEGIVVKSKTMIAGEYFGLPEFMGF